MILGGLQEEKGLSVNYFIYRWSVKSTAVHHIVEDYHISHTVRIYKKSEKTPVFIFVMMYPPANLREHLKSLIKLSSGRTSLRTHEGTLIQNKSIQTGLKYLSWSPQSQMETV